MEVYRIIDPYPLSIALLQDFLEKVFPEDSLAIPGGYKSRAAFFPRITQNSDWGFFVGVEDNELRALALVFAPPPDELDLLRPQILHIYNGGSVKLKAALIAEVVEFLKEKGHIKVWAINGTEAAASVWARAFSRIGPARKVGDIMEFTLRAALPEKESEEQEQGER